MKVREIFLNRKNVHEYQEDNVDCYYGRKCLDKHMEVNDALTDAIENKSIDSGGRYASWLNDIGINHQTDEGWWNETAVCSENMQLFADYENDVVDPVITDAYLDIKSKLNNLPKGVTIEMKEAYVDVEQFIRDTLNY